MTKDKNIFSANNYVFLVVLVPLVQLLEFFIVQDGVVSDTFVVGKSILPYVYIAIFFFILYKRKFRGIHLLIGIYFVLNSLLFSQFSIANNASYMVQIVITFSLLTLPRQRQIQLSEKNKIIILLVYCLIILLYYIFSRERFYEDRIYIVGFVIPHAFSYYCVAFAFFLMSIKRPLFSFIVLIFGVFVGARAGLLGAVLVCCYYFFGLATKKKIKITIISIAMLVCFMPLVSGIFADSNLGITINKTLESFGSFNSANKSSSDDTRTILFNNMLLKATSDGIGIENLFGRGPRSSYEYNERTLGLELWMHNDFAEVFFTLGIIGLFIYIYCLVYYYRTYRNIFSLLIIVVFGLTNGFFPYIPLTMILFFHLIDLRARKKVLQTTKSKALQLKINLP